MFRDDWIAAEGYAHRRLIDVLVRNLASDERLVVHATDSAVPEPLPELPLRERVLWRVACVALFPALLGILALVRGAFGSAGLGSFARAASLRGVGRLAVVLATALVLVRLVGEVRARLDLSADGLNRLAPQTAELAAGAEIRDRDTLHGVRLALVLRLNAKAHLAEIPRLVPVEQALP